MKPAIITTAILSLFTSVCCSAQEMLAPLDHNIINGRAVLPPVHHKTTVISLPFFDDFSANSVDPDPARWIGRSVYINNTMAVDQVSRGVATFDALNERGGPYDSVNMNALVYADSLTSQPIDLSSNIPADSIYLSFFYQPQGNGFAPEVQDSLMLYFKDVDGLWQKIWSKEGFTVAPFSQVMIPVVNVDFLHADFQFRFVNKASINLNDDIWNLDYVRMASGRNRSDTAVNDIATTTEPSFLLSDYTSLPYRQFLANITNELAVQHAFAVRNNYTSLKQLTYGYTAREAITNTPLFTSGLTSPNIAGQTEETYQFPVYTTGFTPANANARVVFEQKYYATQVAGTDVKSNDTIIKQQVFDNYLAYDDGTAEKSYFLKQFATLPAKLAIEFHLNQPDTIGGVAVYFGRQVPLASNKFFSLAVYKDIAVNGGTEQLVYQQDLYFPSYVDTINHFWIYKFDSPVTMPAGTFFLGAIQPASSGSDSLYYGLDVNRVSGNHLYVNVNNFWEPSIFSGAVMIRPLLGQKIVGTGIRPEAEKGGDFEWSVFPNPATDIINASYPERIRNALCEITDMQGRIILRSEMTASKTVDISPLSPGVYLVRMVTANYKTQPKKIIKY